MKNVVLGEFLGLWAHIVAFLKLGEMVESFLQHVVCIRFAGLWIRLDFEVLQPKATLGKLTFGILHYGVSECHVFWYRHMTVIVLERTYCVALSEKEALMNGSSRYTLVSVSTFEQPRNRGYGETRVQRLQNLMCTCIACVSVGGCLFLRVSVPCAVSHDVLTVTTHGSECY